MTRSWNNNPTFKRLSAELAVTDDRDFERRVLPLIRLIWPEAVGAPALRSFDRHGIDHLVWSDPVPFPLIVQCKGFKASEKELGTSQIKQCKKSVTSFSKSGLEAKTYILLHNRSGIDEDFRKEVETHLDILVRSGQVESAELWDRIKFLRAAFNSMVERVSLAISSGQLTPMKHYFEPYPYEPIEQVPLQTFKLLTNNYNLERETPPVTQHVDPSEALIDFEKHNLSVLLGEAGYGKTTAVYRTFAKTKRHIFYIPAAAISERVCNTRTLLQDWVKVEGLFTDVEDSDVSILDRLVYPVMDSFLHDPESPIALFIDGLDESVFFTRRGGIQSLLNQIKGIRVPVVLVARTEFWDARKADFATSFGSISPNEISRSTQKRWIRVLNLLPWEEEQIVRLAQRFRNTLEDTDQKMRLDNLITILKRNGYEQLYGDIPKRPLFLRLILETVAWNDVHLTGRARLLYEGARIKVLRDVSAPRKWGAEGREPIIQNSDSADITLKLSFRAMMLAAYKMTSQQDNALELLPSCDLGQALQGDKFLGEIIDPTGLFLNSLLMPIQSMAHQTQKIRFAHRVYQEFFLALFLKTHPEFLPQDIALPDAVIQYLNDIEMDGLLDTVE